MTKTSANESKFRTATLILSILLCISVIVCFILLFIRRENQTEQLSSLPIPELAEGIRGSQFGIDKNIDEKNLDKYLGRSDTVYRDMRMLKDPGNYESIGGDSYLSGFVKGFEVVPFPYLVNVSGLPESVGNTYTGKTLFTQKEDGTYTPNYEESVEILEYLFPKDKNIILMCGGGGYAGMMKQLLVSLGWDANKIYNAGGYWYYDGSNNIPVKNVSHNDISYDFWKIPYHNIDFSTLHEIKNERQNKAK